MSKFFQIAMDGPAGAGKSTIAKQLAKILNYTFINSGGIYRSVAVYIKQNNIQIDNLNLIDDIVNYIVVEQKGNDMYLNGKNVSNLTWTDEITAIVPKIAQIPSVRSFVKKTQQHIADTDNIVIEGRDTTTAVFPDATLKCWIFADPITRATRRWEQTGKKGTLEGYLNSLNERDKMDAERTLDPMIRANDAFDVDTTNLNIEQSCEIILNKFNEIINNK
ncbi:MAG: (d)CMP kinase [Mycoplasmataceae bacterium]|nr:(d)CMP kinase [Mycoplasmataceae bacterium]